MNSVCNQISNAKGKSRRAGNEAPLRSRARSVMGKSSAGCRSTSTPEYHPQASRSSGLVTKVTARVDTGFGNHLFIRGEGHGLSWDRGQLMACLDSGTWVWSAEAGVEPAAFKLLLNDEVWCQGENLTVAAGAQVEIRPTF